MPANVGYQQPQTAGSNYNTDGFLIEQALKRIQTATLVRVMSVTNAGELSPVGFVDVQPMVHQVDGAGSRSMPHKTIFGVPYSRMQGGTDAIILDPKVGDIGVACFASRDLSSVKSTKQPATPGSHRSHAMADALYIGGVLNGVPEQYVRFSADGIEISTPKVVTVIAAASVQFNTPNVVMSGNLAVGTGATGSFSTATGEVVTVYDGIITNIV